MSNDIERNRTSEIRKLHEQFVSMGTKTLEAGIAIGKLLVQQKNILPHGEFGPWIKDNLPFSKMTASKYMRLYQHRRELKSKGPLLLEEAYEKHLRQPKVVESTASKTPTIIRKVSVTQIDPNPYWIETVMRRKLLGLALADMLRVEMGATVEQMTAVERMMLRGWEGEELRQCLKDVNLGKTLTDSQSSFVNSLTTGRPMEVLYAHLRENEKGKAEWRFDVRPSPTAPGRYEWMQYHPYLYVWRNWLSHRKLDLVCWAGVEDRQMKGMVKWETEDHLKVRDPDDEAYYEGL